MTEEAFVSFYIFNNQRKRNSGNKGFSLMVIIMLFGWLSGQEFDKGDMTMGLFYLITGVFLVTYILFIGKYLVKNRLMKMARSTHIDSFNTKEMVAVKEDVIYLKSVAGETLLNMGWLKEILEVADYFFIVTKNTSGIILPKNQLNDFEVNSFIEKILDKVDIPLTQDLKWKL